MRINILNPLIVIQILCYGKCWVQAIAPAEVLVRNLGEPSTASQNFHMGCELAQWPARNMLHTIMVFVDLNNGHVDFAQTGVCSYSLGPFSCVWAQYYSKRYLIRIVSPLHIKHGRYCVRPMLQQYIKPEPW
jgi:hypothetical protein